MTGRILRHWSLVATFGLAIVPPCTAATTPEYRVKAAFLYKFAVYIRWPPSPAADRAPLVIGILGDDPFGTSLADVVRGQTVHGRVIHIRTLNRAEDGRECHLVFICSSERENLGEILAVLQRAPVLTVGDMKQFAERGGMIGLTTTEDLHVRFDINQGAIETAGLRASAQLLQLGRIVDSREGRRR